jgi:hypothetical protein
MTCYCPPKPRDGKRYIINHKDGDIMNCSADNLEWVIHHYEHTLEPSVVLNCYGNRITVFKDGRVEMDGKPMMIHDSFFDSDMDLEAYIGPHICVSRPRSNYSERVNMDRIMRAAGYVQGDDAIFQNPEILHIDYDEMNWAADNLIWVEGADKRLKEYYAKRKEFCHKRNIELNPGKDVPDWY